MWKNAEKNTEFSLPFLVRGHHYPTSMPQDPRDLYFIPLVEDEKGQYQKDNNKLSHPLKSNELIQRNKKELE